VPDPIGRETETVVLVHGLWLGAWAMACLQRRLRRCGYRCVCYSYPSSARTLAGNAAQLQEFLSRVPGETVHFVGHSLGGLLILQLFKEHPGQRPGRIVTLGTPHQGSFAARRLAGTRIGSRLLGAALPALAHGLALAPAGRETGVIAGNLNFGLGWLIPGIARPNDGTVAVAETHLPGAGDTRVVGASHTALLFSARAARYVCAFLKRGRFTAAEEF